jgi:hypothetical protein
MKESWKDNDLDEGVGRDYCNHEWNYFGGRGWDLHQFTSSPFAWLDVEHMPREQLEVVETEVSEKIRTTGF